MLERSGEQKMDQSQNEEPWLALKGVLGPKHYRLEVWRAGTEEPLEEEEFGDPEDACRNMHRSGHYAGPPQLQHHGGTISSNCIFSMHTSVKCRTTH